MRRILVALLLGGCLSATPGRPPEAQLDAPDRAALGQPVVLDGAASTGIVVQYQFDFGDGSPVEVTATPQTQHSYAMLGPVNACLTVVADTGRQSGAACRRIMVVEELPDGGMPDAAPDARPDAAIDAPVDARPDAAIDAAVDRLPDRPPMVTYGESTLPAGCLPVPAGAATLPPLGDDEGTMVRLPFSFPFFGVPQSAMGVSSNGYLQLGSANQLMASQNRAIPDPRTPNNIVAVFWDDLAPPGMPGSAPVRTFAATRSGGVPGFVVHWQGWTFFSVTMPPATLTFQAVLWQDGVIDLHYCTLDDPRNPARASGAAATVGVEDATGAMGTQHSFNQPNSVSTSAGIRFTPL